MTGCQIPESFHEAGHILIKPLSQSFCSFLTFYGCFGKEQCTCSGLKGLAEAGAVRNCQGYRFSSIDLISLISLFQGKSKKRWDELLTCISILSPILVANFFFPFEIWHIYSIRWGKRGRFSLQVWPQFFLPSFETPGFHHGEKTSGCFFGKVFRLFLHAFDTLVESPPVTRFPDMVKNGVPPGES